MKRSLGILIALGFMLASAQADGLPFVAMPVTSGEAPTQVDEVPVAVDIGRRFMELEHIYATSAVGTGTVDLLFETMSDPAPNSRGMCMIYKYGIGDAFPEMALSFCGKPDEDQDIERVVIITDENIYDFARENYESCLNSDYGSYLFKDAGNMLMNRANAAILREYLSSQDGAIAIGNGNPYTLYRPDAQERALLEAVAAEWEENWGDSWYETLPETARDTLENVFPNATATSRNGDTLQDALDLAYYEPYPELARKSRGDAVVTLQKGLKKLGFDTGAIDGIYGPGTEEIVRAFQSSQGIDPTGIADDATQRAIYKMGAKGMLVRTTVEENTVRVIEYVDVYSIDEALDEPLYN